MFALYITNAINGLVVGGCHFQAFWVGSKPVEAIFHIFGAREKISFFQEKSVFFGKYRYFIGKYRYLSEKIGIYRKNRRIFSDFFTPDFSIPKSFPAPPKSDFSPKNRPKSAIFLSLLSAKAIKCVFLGYSRL